MSDQEFENYLTLIGRLLRLTSSQRQAIGEELRDHFESRLAELVESGVSHAEAVRVALEEFGDAAGLAAQFTTVSQTRKRRLIMRCTVGSVAALAAVLVVAMAAWPERQAGLLLERANAQTAEKQKEEMPAVSARDQAIAETEKRLNQRFDANFTETPLVDVVAFLKENFKVQCYFSSTVLTDAGKDPSTILISSDLSGVRVGKFLSLVLREQSLNYFVENEGLVVISTIEDLETQLTLRIYDCRKILAAAGVLNSTTKPAPLDRANDMRPTDPVPTPLPKEANTAARPRFHLVQAGGFGGSSTAKPTKPAAKPTTPAEKLIDVVTGTIATQTWSKWGGPGTIAEYGGLLVISQTQEVHGQIADLLDQLSEKLAAPVAK